MISIRRISHATFETPDLEAQIEHYTKVTGLVVAAREKDRALLSCKVGQLVLQLVEGRAAALRQARRSRSRPDRISARSPSG